MADVLLDTTFFIDYHRGDAGARSLWTQVSNGTIEASVSPITVFELWAGTIGRIEEIIYKSMLTLCEEAPLRSAHAETAALWLRGVSTQIAEAVIRDAFIAAIAQARNEAICTRNVRDFTRFYANVRSY